MRKINVRTLAVGSESNLNHIDSCRETFFKKIEKALFPFLGTVLFFSFFVNTEVGEAFVLCKNEKTVRTLRIEELEDARCQAYYTKQGVDQVIGTSQNKTFCEDYVVSVRKKLEDAKWNCRDIKESRVSTIPANETP